MTESDSRGQLLRVIDRLAEGASWTTPRGDSDALVWQAAQQCHAYHRRANPAYRERCEHEGIDGSLAREQLPLLVFPEEIWKGYSECVLDDGSKLGVFCERRPDALVNYLNRYLAQPLKLDGLARDYVRGTNLRGGLDRLRADLVKSQDVHLMTSSGTTGSALSLIPVDKTSSAIHYRTNWMLFDAMTDLPGYGPINPETDFFLACAPEFGSMLMSVGARNYASKFSEERRVFTIKAHAYSRELRWRGGAYNGFSGRLLRLSMGPALRVGGKAIARRTFVNTLDGLRRAEASGRRTMFIINQWMFWGMLGRMERMLEDDVRAGRRQAGDPLFWLAPGSLVLCGGGNKSGMDIPEEVVLEKLHRVVGGIARVVDGYGKSEWIGGSFRCERGNYHLDPQVISFQVDGYLAMFDPRETSRVPGQLTGDKIDAVHEEPCPCGRPSRFFRHVARDVEARGAKGCAAALREYVVRK
jgi:hypothetical protein